MSSAPVQDLRLWPNGITILANTESDDRENVTCVLKCPAVGSPVLIYEGDIEKLGQELSLLASFYRQVCLDFSELTNVSLGALQVIREFVASQESAEVEIVFNTECYYAGSANWPDETSLGFKVTKREKVSI